VNFIATLFFCPSSDFQPAFCYGPPCLRPSAKSVHPKRFTLSQTILPPCSLPLVFYQTRRGQPATPLERIVPPGGPRLSYFRFPDRCTHISRSPKRNSLGFAFISSRSYFRPFRWLCDGAERNFHAHFRDLPLLSVSKSFLCDLPLAIPPDGYKLESVFSYSANLFFSR